MSYEDALADLKELFGQKKMLTVRDIAPLIGKSIAAQATLRSRKRFPIESKLMGGQLVFSIYAVAHYFGDPPEASPQPRAEEPAPTSKARASSKARHAKPVSSLPMRRPPSLGKFLRAYRKRITELETELRFHEELFAELEDIEFDRVSTKARGKRPLAKPKRKGLRV